MQLQCISENQISDNDSVKCSKLNINIQVLQSVMELDGHVSVIWKTGHIVKVKKHVERSRLVASSADGGNAWERKWSSVARAAPAPLS